MAPAGPSNVPPAMPMHPGRRQSDYHHHVPPPMHSPLPHNPYGNYHPPYHSHGHPLHYPPPQQFYPGYQPIFSPTPTANSSSSTATSCSPARTHSSTSTINDSRELSSRGFAAYSEIFSGSFCLSSTIFVKAFVQCTPASNNKNTLLSTDEPFPPKALRRRRRRRDLQFSEEPLKLPSRDQSGDISSAEEPKDVREQMAAAQSDLETPATSQAPSEADSTQPTTPSSSLPTSSGPRPVSQPQTYVRTQTRPAVPIIPATPTIPGSAVSHHRAVPSASQSSVDQASASTAPDTRSVEPEHSENNTVTPTASAPAQSPETVSDATSPPMKPTPKSWADLVRTKATPSSTTANIPTSNGTLTNGVPASGTTSLGEALRDFEILQVLVFCVPFYDFLDQVGKRAIHNFKSDTPLVDAMIMFMREFNVIDSAVSVEQLQKRLKDSELEQYGEAFVPEYVYDVIKQLPRFSSMRRGHQQDAEEFLGFLLEGLHDECALVMKSALQNTPSLSSENTPIPSPTAPTDGGWLEVGPKQKAAITRSSGSPSVPTPVTKIFGGKLRSELRVPGLKNSVTLEPYKPLQLDIGAPQVNSITDALKNLTRSETLSGDFNSPRGSSTATKQVFIETLPPVLILHLKRFQYDSSGGTQKIWKRIGYPLELEIPKEAFPPSKRGAMSSRGASPGPPKYRLISVVYHHGKNATGGHYTVDVRRQEGREWIRMDDTLIRRVRSEDVALAVAAAGPTGAEEDPRALAAALENHRRDQAAGRNLFEQVGLDEEAADGEVGSDAGDADAQAGGWKEVNGAATASGGAAAAAGRKWAGVVNGTATPSTTGKRTPMEKGGVRDNKVAYILFYQQI
ncbi:MAG: hypothetical protein Q9165_001967 [Trypethelium subeluteriae]